MRMSDLNNPISLMEDNKTLRAYHGTSSDKLSTILSQGLKSSLGGGYGSDIKGDFNNRSKTPIGGVYVTEDLNYARMAGKRMAVQNSANLVLIEIEVDSDDIVPDEDMVANRLEAALAFNNPTNIFPIFQYWMNLKYLNTDKTEEIKDNIIKSLRTVFSESMQDIDSNILLNYALHYYERKVSYLNQSNQTKTMDSIETIAKFGTNQFETNDEVKEFTESVINNIPTSVQVEKNYLNQLDIMTRKLKNIIQSSSGRGNFRIPQDVGFNGSTKILSIVEEQKDDEVKYIIHYGKPSDEMKRGIESFIGKNVEFLKH